MMQQVACPWISEVSRGPDWLFVRLRPDTDSAGQQRLAERICQLLEQHFLNRLVLEMDLVDRLQSELIGELVRIHKRICSRGGMMRLSGLSDTNQDVLRQSRLDDRFPRFHNRHDAVMGLRPHVPR